MKTNNIPSQKVLNILNGSWQSGWAPVFNGDIIQWCNKYISLPAGLYAVPGNFSVEHSRYMIKPMHTFADNTVRQINICAGIQCFGKDTKVLMYDGTTKYIQDIKIGEYVVGDNGECRKVIDDHRGQDELYLIKPRGTHAEPYVVSRKHIMCLRKQRTKNDIRDIDMLLEDYLDLLKRNPKVTRNRHYAYQSKVDWSKQDVTIDPYFLGLWLGDGHSRGPCITNMEPEIEEYLHTFAKKNDMRITKELDKRSPVVNYHVIENVRKKTNRLKEHLKSYDLLHNKHIPLVYLRNDRETRLQLLAGFIDTDGYRPTKKGQENVCVITQKSDRISNDIAFLSRSLGFRCSINKYKTWCQGEYSCMVNHIKLYGDLTIIPTKVKRKQYTENSCYNIPNHYGFDVIPQGVGDYYGIQVDGPNGRFLLSDFSVVHNTFKTGLILNYLPWSICNTEPGRILMLFQTDLEALKQAQSRILPLLKSIKPLRKYIPMKRWAIKNKGVIFNNAHLFIEGMRENVVQGFPYKTILMDECYLYKYGLISEAKKRADSFPNSSKIILASQAGDNETEWMKEFYSAEKIYSWGWRCPNPECNQLQGWEWRKKRDDGTYSGINFDTTLKNDDGSYMINKIANSAVLECHYCRHRFADDVGLRKKLNAGGEYILVQKDGPEKNCISFHWPSMAAIHVSFYTLVKEYLMARMEEKSGNISKIKEFYQKRLCSLYREINLNVIEATEADYKMESDWKEEMFRTMAVDVQKDFALFYYVIRSFAVGGKSRQIARGTARSFAEIETIRKRNNVPKNRVAVDAGYMKSETLNHIARQGHVGVDANGKSRFFCYLALDGDRNETGWNHYSEKLKDNVYQPYSKTSMNKSTHDGRLIPSILWSNSIIKDRLYALYTSKDDIFTVPKDLPDSIEYSQHMSAETKQAIADKKTGKKSYRWINPGDKPNHFLDCEAMCLVMSILSNKIWIKKN